jgi:hypothetical protein
MTGGQSPAEAKDFSSSLCVQTSSEANPALYAVGTGGCYLVGKEWPGCDADPSPPSSAKIKEWVEALLPLLLSTCIMGSGTALLHFIMTVTNQNYIHEETRKWFSWFSSRLSCCFMSHNTIVRPKKMYRNNSLMKQSSSQAASSYSSSQEISPLSKPDCA